MTETPADGGTSIHPAPRFRLCLACDVIPVNGSYGAFGGVAWGDLFGLARFPVRAMGEAVSCRYLTICLAQIPDPYAGLGP